MTALPKDFVVTVLIVKGDSVLLAKHKKLGLWLPIGGHIKKNESIEQALEREIAEESGIKVKLAAEKYKEVEWKEVRALPLPFQVQLEHIDGKHEHIDLIYAAKYLSGKERLAKKEHYAIKWFSLGEIGYDKSEHISEDVKFLAKKAVEIVNASNKKN